MIQTEIAGNEEEFFSITERIAAVVIKLIKRYWLKIAEGYDLTPSYDGEDLNSFYEEVESTIE